MSAHRWATAILFGALAAIIPVTADDLPDEKAAKAKLDDEPKAPAIPPPPKDIVKKLDAGVAASKAGKMGDMVVAFASVLETAKPEFAEQIEAYLKQCGVEEKLTDLVPATRIAWLIQNALGNPATTAKGVRPNESAGTAGTNTRSANRIAGPGKVEMPLLLAALERQIDDLRTPIQKELDVGFGQNMPHVVMDEKVKLYLDMLQQVAALDALLDYAGISLKKINRVETEKLGDVGKRWVDRDIAEERKQAKTFDDQLVERLVEVSIARLDDAMMTLQNDTVKYTDRFKAAGRVNESLAMLKEYWDRFRRRKNPDARNVNPKELEKQWKEKERRATELAGQLREKSFHLEQGKKWWFRGRYGTGQMNEGMVKAPSPRVRNQDWALLYCPLAMPNPIRPPKDPLKDPRNIPPARRHLELYKIVVATAISSNRLQDILYARPDASLEEIFRKESDAGLKAIDHTRPWSHYVGYLEYQMALYHWEKLLAMTSEAERKSLDELFGDDPRTAVHSYLSRQFDNVDPQSSLKPIMPRVEDPRSKGPYERRGLSWAMALARLEIGAMRALQTESPTAESTLAAVNEARPNGGRIVRITGSKTAPIVDPAFTSRDGRGSNASLFLLETPSAFERAAYKEVLWDGMRHQYYLLRLQIVMRQRGNQTLANMEGLLARLSLAIDMIRAFETFVGTAELTVQQRQELQSWLTWLEIARGQATRGLHVQRVAVARNRAAFGIQSDIGDAARFPGPVAPIARPQDDTNPDRFNGSKKDAKGETTKKVNPPAPPQPRGRPLPPNSGPGRFNPPFGNNVGKTSETKNRPQ